MPDIHQLPDHIIAQIAAGEVIERPAYAVKELLENAIDANASHIQIFLEEAGLKKIIIIDDGEGMTPENIYRSYRHHTTSKLHDTLIGIKSFGFRGEALSSIASISNMTIKSRPHDKNAGSMVELHYGNLIKESVIGMPPGTAITVNDLFMNVPARKKFLRSSKTEFRHCLDIALHTAIAYPEIRFQLSHNGKLVFDFPRTNDKFERLKHLFGNDILAHMVQLNASESFITISGYISTPHIMSGNNSKQYIFINDRYITDRTISQKVKEAYGSLLTNTTYPLFALFISLPHEMVDVNVHPRKEQIAFMNSESIVETIKRIIEKTVQTTNLTYTPSLWKKEKINNMPDYATSTLRDAIEVWGNKKNTDIMHNSDVTQMHNLYLIGQTFSGILFIDQHAAHERILYEKYAAIFKEKKNKADAIQVSETTVMAIEPEMKVVLEEYKETITSLGFAYEDFGYDAIKITHVPELFKDHNILVLFNELLENISQEKDLTIDSQSKKMISYLACRSAVKAGDKLSKKEIKELLDMLNKTPNNATCPHGRPTRIELSLKDINKQFKRV